MDWIETSTQSNPIEFVNAPYIIDEGMQSEIDLLRQRITDLEAENDKIKAENVELKARVAKLEDK